jgi:hypothetical protein
MATFRFPDGASAPRNRSTVVLMYGLLLLAIGAGTRQAFYLALGTAWIAIGVGVRTRDRDRTSTRAPSN